MCCSLYLSSSFLTREAMQALQGTSLQCLRDLDIDLDGFLILNEMTQHLGIVFQSIDTRGKQLVQPPREEGFGFDQVIHAADEVSMQGVDGANHHLVPKHEALVDLVCIHSA